MEELLRINLLDWRQYRREERRKNFFQLLALTVVGSVALVAGVSFLYFGHQIDVQKSRNALLSEKISTAKQQISELNEVKQQRKSLIKRMGIIEDLQQSRADIVHYFDQVVETIPSGVYLVSLSLAGDQTTLKGRAESNAQVSKYMTNLDQSNYFARPKLIVIKSQHKDGKQRVDFTLTVDSIHHDAAAKTQEALNKHG